MTERPATRADLRAGVWRWLYEPRGTDRTEALRLLAALDQEEGGEEAAGRYVARVLAHTSAVIDRAGRVHLRRREREAVR
ncbi:MAG TPA: hypothetical protein VLM76_02030 [Patescibacteria group bacterium]|nr:hypothetical protein [Patescibacteria group bacterium]